MSFWEGVEMSVEDFEAEFAALCDDDPAVRELDRLVEVEAAGGEWVELEFRISDRHGLPSGLPIVRELGEAMRMCVEVNGGGGGPFLRGEPPYYVECRPVGHWAGVGDCPDWDDDEPPVTAGLTTPAS